MSKISRAGSSRAKTSDPWPVGTKAIVQREDFLCIGLKLGEGAWVDIHGSALNIDAVLKLIELIPISN